MRIIAGEAKGRRLVLPKGFEVRPTSDKVKEALFNLLPSVKGKAFLDLYAGSGSVGLEALSRGAAIAVFVEKKARLADAIRKNLQTMGLTAGEVLGMEARRGLTLLEDRGRTFDVIFADPPYERGLLKDIFKSIAKSRLASVDALIVLQHSIREDIQEADSFDLVDQRRYGDTILSFLKLKEKEA